MRLRRQVEAFMINRIFPRQFDNRYRGNRLAIWLLVPVILIELLIGANSVINTRAVATGPDAIPLDSFGTGGAQAVLALFALLGLCRLLFALQGVVVLVRYRAMIPFTYLLLLILQLGSKALSLVRPIASSGASSAQIGSAVILALLAMLLIGFVLSLLNETVPPDDPI
jgi:hypothetical protein